MWRAADVDEAVRIAAEVAGNQEGPVAFRGQRDSRWRVRSSRVRMAVDEPEAIGGDALDRFLAWSARVPELRAFSIAQRVAAAQHHGWPTTFVDWTTEPEVAGYFACADHEEGGEGVILLVDLDEWAGFWDLVRGVRPALFDRLHLDVVRVEVPDLWRLQRQHGLFLEIAFDGIEDWFGFDRVLFPHGPASGAIVRRLGDHLLPPERSALEERVLEFAMEERMHVNAASPEHRDAMALMSVMEVPAPPGLALGGPDPSWTGLDPAWWVLPDESPSSTARTDLVPLDKVLGSSDGHDLSAAVAGLDAFADAAERRSPSAFVAGPDADATMAATALLLGRTWNGMRALPYDRAELAQALVGTFLRARLIGRLDETRPADDVEREAAEHHRTCAPGGLADRIAIDAVGLEMGRDESAGYVRACCSLACLERALSAPARATGWHVLHLLQLSRRARDVFTFDGLRACWATDVIPTQVVWRRRVVGPLVHFSPARVEAIGRP